MELIRDLAILRADFPILSRCVYGKPLVYLDSAATSQRPKRVLDAITHFYENENANVHRGVYYLSERATERFEEVRGKVAKFIGAPDKDCVIYTRGTSEAINLVANGLSDQVGPGDTVVVTRMEHHSNFVPWQQLAKRKGANFRIVEIKDDGNLDLDSYTEAMRAHPKIVAFTHVSNVLGVVNPVARLAQMASDAGAITVLDAAQSVPHMKFNILELGPIDFVAFSAHKMGGPTGIGVLWGRRELLEKMQPYQLGGSMIGRVGDEDTTWAPLPSKFEAGTPNIAGVVGLGAAIDYLNGIGMEAIEHYEHELANYALEEFKKVPSLTIHGPLENRTALFSMSLGKVHPHDLATFLDRAGIAVRAGHHCAQPLMRKLGLPATTRASFYFYNTPQDVELLVASLQGAERFFK